jgi:hypothetical protein
VLVPVCAPALFRRRAEEKCRVGVGLGWLRKRRRRGIPPFLDSSTSWPGFVFVAGNEKMMVMVVWLCHQYLGPVLLVLLPRTAATVKRMALTFDVHGRERAPAAAVSRSPTPVAWCPAHDHDDNHGVGDARTHAHTRTHEVRTRLAVPIRRCAGASHPSRTRVYFAGRRRRSRSSPSPGAPGATGRPAGYGAVHVVEVRDLWICCPGPTRSFG